MNESIFHYSILQYRHDLLTKEFLNVGLVAYNESTRQFHCRITKQLTRISATFPGVDLRFLQKYFTQLQKKFEQIENDITFDSVSLIPKYPSNLSSIIKSVLPHDDSSVYFSEVYKSSFSEFSETFNTLFKRFILPYNKEIIKESRDDHEVWETFRKPLSEVGILSKLQSYTIDVKFDQIQLDYGWKNGKVNAIQPISFDMVNPTNMRRKAKEWIGNITLLDKTNQISNLYLVIGNPSKPTPELTDAYEDTKGMLLNRPENFDVSIIEEPEAVFFATKIKPQIEADLQSHNSMQD